jgi:hypothetical protein
VRRFERGMIGLRAGSLKRQLRRCRLAEEEKEKEEGALGVNLGVALNFKYT